MSQFSLFVGNVSKNVDQKRLEKEFSKFGECTVDLRIIFAAVMNQNTCQAMTDPLATFKYSPPILYCHLLYLDSGTSKQIISHRQQKPNNMINQLKLIAIQTEWLCFDILLQLRQFQPSIHQPTHPSFYLPTPTNRSNDHQQFSTLQEIHLGHEKSTTTTSSSNCQASNQATIYLSIHPSILPPTNPYNQHRKYAFVSFKEVRDAEDAKKQMHKKDLGGLLITVEWSKQSGRFEENSSSGKYSRSRRRSSRSRSRRRSSSKDRNRRRRRYSRSRSSRSHSSDRKTSRRRDRSRSDSRRRTRRSSRSDSRKNSRKRDEKKTNGSDRRRRRSESSKKKKSSKDDKSPRKDSASKDKKSENGKRKDSSLSPKKQTSQEKKLEQKEQDIQNQETTQIEEQQQSQQQQQIQSETSNE